ncbi:Na-translocating system protein MpsC family protein [Alteribacillus sp. HJP-4]|uniref:Na-translocating system protein MpsC family protein n=1 Tax=Alteribacillus sp. HJP-4 TaxID=2775394 RepID=UPI0035CD1CF7
MVLAVLHEGDADQLPDEYTGRKQLHNEVVWASQQAEKTPTHVDSYLLNERTLIVLRKGILVRIEKELIRAGFEENLKLTKRHLEKGLINNQNLEKILQTGVLDTFVDWDFQLDKSYFIFILQPPR